MTYVARNVNLANFFRINVCFIDIHVNINNVLHWRVYSFKHMNQLYREFGRLLKQRRKQARLTQDDVAHRVGLARTSITNIEQGRQHVSLHMIYALADAIGVGPQELLPSKSILPQKDTKLEEQLEKVELEEEGKDWIRRIVSKAQGEGKGDATR
jgi:transcriptional regulator with XRE-family HTH domain